jgi:hypothetical protein
MDGKHILLQCPTNSGSQFFNYKGTFSIILFVVVDANYCFKYALIRCIFPGKWRQTAVGDTGIVNLTRIPRRPPNDAKSVREEFKQFFM